MTLEECYNAIGGNYIDVLKRLLKEERVLKFVKAFPSQDLITPIETALNNKDYKNAFMASHSLKGVCATLSFSRLYKSSSDLTECLRGEEVSEDPLPLFKIMKENYEETLDCISKLDD